MKLVVHRYPSSLAATVGTLTLDGVPFCFTLEDVVREADGVPVPDWKIAGQTAIPRGCYPVTMDFSPHFGKRMPHVQNVPGFAGIRIHPGNSSGDTEGCLLVGYADLHNGTIGRSREAFAALYDEITHACLIGEPVSLTINA